MHATVGVLPAALKDRIAAGVLFGDTRNTQDKGKVPNFPEEKTKVYCDKNDGVCGGWLNVNAGHFVYTIDGSGDLAIKFLKDSIDEALAAKGGA
jgi:cutinase